MSNFQKIKINEIEYYIVDSIQNLRAEDSFIHRQNKLKIFKGNGESRKYIGSYTGNNGEKLKHFFEYDKWGDTKINNKRVYPIIQENCFFSKENLLKYLYDARVEYQKQEQIYNFDISKNFEENLKQITQLKENILKFSIYDVSDFMDNKRGNRAYIRSDSKIWDIWRKLVLPKISYLSILKLLPMSNLSAKPIYYFRILLDYQFRSIVHSQLTTSSIDTVSKTSQTSQKTVSRDGASKYRKQVIEHMSQCPFSKISDDRLLIASHIKPYNICVKENKPNEAIDYLNGLALSPTYDKLFDQGYITFSDKGELICGTQLSAYTWEKLHINPNAKNIMRIYPEKREKYLDFHRKYVFQDNISDLI
ncbi:MAG TPA: HNH endonuclease [Campylobacterales bacterium]|nr:HNH endonuclease [Campylobacterales bacterium]HHS92713.1 HNH endonuclease [Campylobacterales bacterium]